MYLVKYLMLARAPQAMMSKYFFFVLFLPDDIWSQEKEEVVTVLLTSRKRKAQGVFEPFYRIGRSFVHRKWKYMKWVFGRSKK